MNFCSKVMKSGLILFDAKKKITPTTKTGFYHTRVRIELPWPSGYELRLSLERSRVLILVKVIGEDDDVVLCHTLPVFTELGRCPIGTLLEQ